jgi:hypothetical protein
VLEIKPGDVDIKKLSEIQNKAGLLPNAMSSYINWLIDSGIEKIQTRFKEVFPRLRAEVASELNVHVKLIEQVAYLQFSISNVLDWLLDKGAIDEDFARKLQTESFNIFLEHASVQNERIKNEDPVSKFIDVVNALMFQKKISLLDRNGGSSGGDRADAVGYFDEEYYYFIPTPLWNAVQKFNYPSGEYFPSSKKTILATLEKRGLCKTRHSFKFEGKVHKVIRIPRGAISQ